MTTDDNGFLVKISNNFECKICNYCTSRKYNLDLHLNSKKHKKLILTTKNNDFLVKLVNSEKNYKCFNCDKLFNDRAGLWRHNKKFN